MMTQAKDYVWVLDFDGVNVSANTYACSIANKAIADGGVVACSFSFDMSAAATGYVTGTLAGSQVTVTIDGYVWDLEETTPGPLSDTICHGEVRVRKYVTA